MLTQSIEPNGGRQGRLSCFSMSVLFLLPKFDSLHTDRMFFLYILSKENCFILTEWQVRLWSQPFFFLVWQFH